MPRRLFARSVAYLIVLIYGAGTATNIWLQSRLHVQGDHLFESVMLLLGFGAFAVVGALLVSRTPANPVGWILAAVGIIAGLFPTGYSYAAYVMSTRGHPDALAILGAWTQSWYWYLLLSLFLVYLPLLFPDERLSSRRWLPLAILIGIVTLITVVLGALTDTLTGQEVDYRLENPIGIEGLAPVEYLPVFGVLSALLGVGILVAVSSVVVRFRRARGIERQQIKWFLYAASLILTLPVLDRLPNVLDSVVFNLVVIALPSAIWIAVLRYCLYDIDVVINRTLVYGARTVSLVLIYLGGVVSLQFVFRTLTGEESRLAVVASTLAIAALFNPLRHQAQALVDRRFYRRKYDAAKTLDEFGSRLREETDLDALRAHLAEVVRGTMQPARISLGLLDPSEGERR